MFRHDEFLEHVHRLLFVSGADCAVVTRAIDDLLHTYGELVPSKVAFSAKTIDAALARGGILSARGAIESLRALERAARVSGVFDRPSASSTSVTPRYRILTFEVDDSGAVQLLCRDSETPVFVGEPRHVLLAHYAFHTPNAILADAIQASGSKATRVTKVFDEARVLLGQEWWADSDSSGFPEERVIRFRPHRDVAGAALSVHRVRALTRR